MYRRFRFRARLRDQRERGDDGELAKHGEQREEQRGWVVWPWPNASRIEPAGRSQARSHAAARPAATRRHGNSADLPVAVCRQGVSDELPRDSLPLETNPAGGGGARSRRRSLAAFMLPLPASLPNQRTRTAFLMQQYGPREHVSLYTLMRLPTCLIHYFTFCCLHLSVSRPDSLAHTRRGLGLSRAPLLLALLVGVALLGGVAYAGAAEEVC
jgi:hypothetical protein